ncbi:hypothetical protein JCM31739_10710 [Faecalimonas canis]
MLEIIKFWGEKFVIPIIVTTLGFIIQYFFSSRRERKNQISPMYVSELTSAEQVLAIQPKIAEAIIYFYNCPPQEMDGINIDGLDINLVFKQITVEQLKEKVQEGKHMIYGFEKLEYNSIQIMRFVYGNGTIVDTDNKVVPSFICKDCKCCFVCPESDAPSSMMGQYMNYPIKYVVEGKTSGISKPYIKNKRKFRRDR